MSGFNVAARLLHPDWLADSTVVLFEDGATAAGLFPLNVLRPSWEIRAGLGCLRQWVTDLAGPAGAVVLRPRGELAAVAAQQAGLKGEAVDGSRPVVFLNGRVLSMAQPPGGLPRAVRDPQGQILWAKLSGKDSLELLAKSGTELAAQLVKRLGAEGAPAAEWGVESAAYCWDFMAATPQLLQSALLPGQAEILDAKPLDLKPEGVFVQGEAGVYRGRGVEISPTVVLDARAGGIWLGDGVVIEPHCYLQGPLAVGPHCRVKAGARLYQGSSLGPQCRVGGEVSQSVLQGYVNKQHDGFLGNSHLGQWVNLGADTTVSNLRNDYGPVKLKVGQKPVDSGRQFVGLLAGDHSKTGINTMFNTGTIVGVGANVFGAGYPPRLIRSFSWGWGAGVRTEPLDRMLDTARIVMARRGQELTAAEQELLAGHFTQTVTREK